MMHIMMYGNVPPDGDVRDVGGATAFPVVGDGLATPWQKPQGEQVRMPSQSQLLLLVRQRLGPRGFPDSSQW
jgi:hypothetical protein